MKPLPNETFAGWFARQNFRHFQADEISWMFRRVNKGVRNSEPPREIWVNIVPPLRLLDDLRAHLGAAITLNSTYRNLPYNRSVNSGDGSSHVKFNAIDFKVAGHSPSKVFAILHAWRAAGKFTGGLGKYPNFVHIDTRKSNTTW